MSSSSNMVIALRLSSEETEKPQVSFGSTTSLYEDGSTSEEETKDCDGPNLSSMVFGQIVSGYILGHYTSVDSFRSLYENSLIATNGDEWKAALSRMIDGIKACGCQTLYYRSYQIKKVHIPKLEEIAKIIRLAHLEVRYENLLAYAAANNLTCTVTPLHFPCRAIPA